VGAGRVGKVVCVVCDSLGVGGAPDADDFGDGGADTLAHVAAAIGGIDAPNLGSIGLGHLTTVAGVPPVKEPSGVISRFVERSAAKDTTTGHWEMMGVVSDTAPPLYPDGFPPEVIDAFCQAIGRDRVLGNRPASGTQIIEELGDEQVASGDPIVYTSGDSVFQIATHKSVVPLETLYAWCQAARDLLQGEHPVGRVIARPFDGPEGGYFRTTERRDYALPPTGPTALEAVAAAGVRTFGVGKIEDIFSWRGIDESRHTGDNETSLDATVEYLGKSTAPAFVFTNLVDFDMVYGHRRDAEGYARCLERLDRRLPEVLGQLGPDDWFFLTADHGCDPTAPGTDHTRERTPMLAWSPGGTAGVVLPDRSTYADLGATIADLFGTTAPGPGTSFASELR
jgi:phosphopentomutase